MAEFLILFLFISYLFLPWELCINKIWQIKNKKCSICGTKNNLIIDVYNLGGFVFRNILPKSWLCNYHYRKDRKITSDDFTTWLDCKESKIQSRII